MTIDTLINILYAALGLTLMCAPGVIGWMAAGFIIDKLYPEVKKDEQG